MNDGKKRRSSAELPAHKRFAKSRSRWIYPSFQNTVFVFCGDWGSAPTSMKQAGFALLASFLFPFVTPLKPWFSMPHIA